VLEVTHQREKEREEVSGLTTGYTTSFSLSSFRWMKKERYSHRIIHSHDQNSSFDVLIVPMHQQEGEGKRKKKQQHIKATMNTRFRCPLKLFVATLDMCMCFLHSTRKRFNIFVLFCNILT
jgi:hypothetical protein